MNPTRHKETFISQHLKPYHDAMREWCRGKMWAPRLAMLIWFFYLWIHYFSDHFYFPRFSWLNFGIHELGHFVFMPLGEFMSFLGGSLSQCLVPVFSFFMFYRQRDWFAMAFCFGWLSTNLYYVATYIGDARSQSIPLVTPGGGEARHDWAYLLGRMNLLEYDHVLASITRIFAFTSMLLFLGIGLYQVWLMITLPKEKRHIDSSTDNW